MGEEAGPRETVAIGSDVLGAVRLERDMLFELLIELMLDMDFDASMAAVRLDRRVFILERFE